MGKDKDQVLAEIQNRLHYAGRALLTAEGYAEDLNSRQLTRELQDAFIAVSKASDTAAAIWPRRPVPLSNRA